MIIISYTQSKAASRILAFCVSKYDSWETPLLMTGRKIHNPNSKYNGRYIYCIVQSRETY